MLLVELAVIVEHVVKLIEVVIDVLAPEEFRVVVVLFHDLDHDVAAFVFGEFTFLHTASHGNVNTNSEVSGNTSVCWCRLHGDSSDEGEDGGRDQLAHDLLAVGQQNQAPGDGSLVWD